MRISFVAATAFLVASPCLSAPLSFQDLRDPAADAALHEITSDAKFEFFDQGDNNDEWHPSPIERPADITIDHYDLRVSVDPRIGKVAGTVKIHGTSDRDLLTRIAIDAVDMTFERVRVNGTEAAALSYNGSLLLVDLAEPQSRGDNLVIEIRYKALHPQRLRITGPDATNPERMVAAYTYTQPLGSRHWFPCLDRPSAKATLNIDVVVPDGFNALSNGWALPSPMSNVFPYRMEQPVAPYLVSLAIGTYEIIDLGDVGETNLTLWTPPAIREHALREVKHTNLMMDVFQRFTGTEYPFGDYAQSVSQAWGSSMEHQAATTMGGMRITGDGSGEGVVAHELAHQWFGDHVTCETWEELWLNEGFASYLPMLFFQANEDESGELGYRDYWREGYFAEAKTFSRPLSSTSVNHGDIFDSHAYQKGALVIHLMRHVANQLPIVQGMEPFNGETFTAALATYFRRHGGGNVRNQDLQSALEWVTGTSWQRFFNQWVRSEGHPILNVRSEQTNTALTLRLEQVQATRQERQWRAFSFPLEVELIYADGSREIKEVAVFGKEQILQLELDKELAAYELNPRWIVPLEIDRQYELGASVTYLSNSKERLGRLARIRALAKTYAEQATLPDAFIASLKAEPNDYVLAEAVSAIATLKQRLDHVQDVFAELIFRNSDDRYINDVIAKTESWLTIEAAETLSAEQQAQLQHRYLLAFSSNQRRYLMDTMLYADQPRAHQFALDRLAEDHWPTRDRRFLVDALSQRVSDVSRPFLADMMASGTLYHKARMLNNLIDEGGQHPNLVQVSVVAVAEERYTWSKQLMLSWLKTQTEARDQICPKILELLAGGAEGNQLGEETYAPVQEELQGAKETLSCQ